MIDPILTNLFSGSLLLSWTISLVVMAILVAPPLLALFLTKRSMPRFKYTAAGAVFGALAVPLSFWLYIHFFVGPLRALIFGLPGVLLLGVNLSIFRNVGVASHDMVVNPLKGFTAGLTSTSFQEVIFLIFIYAFLGALIDWYRASRSSRSVGV